MKIYLATNVTRLVYGVVLMLPHQHQRREHQVDVIDIEILDVEAMGLTNEDVEPMLQPFEGADIDDIMACQINQPIQFKAGEMFGYDGEVNKAMHGYMVRVSDQSAEVVDDDQDEADDPEEDSEDEVGDQVDAGRIDDLIEAIEMLEDGNADHWTNNGLPEVAALKELTGGSVTAKERDEAWAAYNVGNNE